MGETSNQTLAIGQNLLPQSSVEGRELTCEEVRKGTLGVKSVSEIGISSEKVAQMCAEDSHLLSTLHTPRFLGSA